MALLDWHEVPRGQEVAIWIKKPDGKFLPLLQRGKKITRVKKDSEGYGRVEGREEKFFPHTGGVKFELLS